jgi:hypothetical protein
VGAYAAGSSHDSFTTVCGIAVLVSAVSAYATVILLSFVLVSKYRTLRYDSTVGQDDEPEKALAGSEREMLLVLAIFAATIAYVAGLNPPGGFWRSTEEGHHTAGDPVLQALHPRRYRVFFVCNTIAFIASLLAIMLIVDRKKYRLNFKGSTTVTYVAMYVCILTALLQGQQAHHLCSLPSCPSCCLHHCPQDSYRQRQSYQRQKRKQPQHNEREPKVCISYIYLYINIFFIDHRQVEIFHSAFIIKFKDDIVTYKLSFFLLHLH